MIQVLIGFFVYVGKLLIYASLKKKYIIDNHFPFMNKMLNKKRVLTIAMIWLALASS